MLPERSAALVPADSPVAAAPVAGLPHSDSTAPSCTNCGAAVPGHFCGNCGQRFDHAVHSVWHFTREATEDLTHADSRVWKTLAALLFKPGFLTREFLGGKRARYLPPLRLYLVLSVFFFLVATSSHHQTKVVGVSHNEDSHASTTAKRTWDFQNVQPKPGETPEQNEARVCQPEYDGPARSFIMPFLKKGCRSVVQDQGRTVTESFMHNVPRAMFLFLPVLALVMMGLYWHPRRYYVEHLLFFVHSHAFAFLLLGLLSLLSEYGPSWLSGPVTFVVWLYVPYYLFVAMRRVYGQSRLRTFMKLTVLSFAYFFGAAVMLALISVYSVFTL